MRFCMCLQLWQWLCCLFSWEEQWSICSKGKIVQLLSTSTIQSSIILILVQEASLSCISYWSLLFAARGNLCPTQWPSKIWKNKVRKKKCRENLDKKPEAICRSWRNRNYKPKKVFLTTSRKFSKGLPISMPMNRLNYQNRKRNRVHINMKRWKR